MFRKTSTAKGEELLVDGNPGVLEASLEERRTLDRAGSYLFSYLLAAVLLAALVWAGGVWNFLANTRILDFLIRAGFIEYHDAQTGFIQGVPDLKYYLKSQDAVKWGLVELAALLLLLFWMIRAAQFHAIALFCGIRGTFTQHARAYLEGVGINRLLPFNRGHVRMAEVFHKQGASLPQISQALLLSEVVLVLSIAVFALLALTIIGWSVWLAQLFWPLVILGVSAFLVRAEGERRERAVTHGSWREAVRVFRALAREPLALAKIGALALLAFALLDVAAYLIAMAFTSDNVILNVRLSVLLMGVVGGYIARLIPVTPGGIGQFEWGFAAALYAGGLGFPESMTIAILNNAVFYVSGTLLLAWVYILRVDYSFEVLKRVEPKTPGAEV